MATIGSGLTVTVTVNDSPSHPAALTGTTVYTTLTGKLVKLVNASLNKAFAVKPLAIAAPPAETDKLFNCKLVTLYVVAPTELLELKLTPNAASLQIVTV